MAKYILLATAVKGISTGCMDQLAARRYDDEEEAQRVIRETLKNSSWRLFTLSYFAKRWNEGTTEVNRFLTPDSSYLAILKIGGKKKKKGAKNG